MSHALNEAWIEKTMPGHTVHLRLGIAGEAFTTYAADGLIVRMDEYRTRAEAVGAMQLRREALAEAPAELSRTPAAPVDGLIPFVHVADLARSIAFYERRRAGVLISRMTNDVEALDDLVTDSVVTLFQASLTLVGTIAILLVLDVRLALQTFLHIPVMRPASPVFRTSSPAASAPNRLNRHPPR